MSTPSHQYHATAEDRQLLRDTGTPGAHLLREDSASRPVFLLVDDDPGALDELRVTVERRYGGDYHILVEASAAAALRRLEQLHGEEAEVALVIADPWMPEMTGVDLLTRARDLHPGAKRVLVIDTMDQSAVPAILQATALGRIDLHLHRPWTPADDLLHPPITELLAEWTRSNRPRFERERIVGDRWDARSHELRDVLERNTITSGLYPTDSPAARALLEEHGVGIDRLPVVFLHGGRVLVQPTNLELAAALGVKTHARPESCDVAVIGSGPAGLAAAVYASPEGLRTVVVEREAMGGQAGTSSMIRNYLSFPRGVSGMELAARAHSQAWHFGAEFIFAQEAIGLRSEGAERVVTLSGGSELRARTVLLATGVSYRRRRSPASTASLAPASSTGPRAPRPRQWWVSGCTWWVRETPRARRRCTWPSSRRRSRCWCAATPSPRGCPTTWSRRSSGRKGDLLRTVDML